MTTDNDKSSPQETAEGQPVDSSPLVRQVAAFKLPVSVRSLAAMVDGLTREYGKGLLMKQVGDSLVILQPNIAISGKFPHIAVMEWTIFHLLLY